MQIWFNIVLAVQLLAAVAMIGLVLVQHGKGADMGASFGSGSSGSLFGATGSANFLSRTTAVCATVFFVCTLALAYLSNYRGAEPAANGGGSVLDRAVPAASAPAASTPAQVPGAIPGAIPGVAEPAVPAAPVPAPVASDAAPAR
ncbi:preprotein translocase subunit SecG [uncultured Azohydromonas sp.]|jgi:protein translocase, SecG subunit|uniref:preprotein translocase subunit SecG n=1 Tax=uncultured Azohydromonas sp. TaxID=487342 RepID=UPI0026122F6A|nr:preprotein translocase subunit SecG [uncultured Azohydromonas sp.]